MPASNFSTRLTCKARSPRCEDCGLRGSLCVGATR
ncbi:MAG: hypothetical protein AB7G21_06170 [Dehalococcoidia bacterium]